MFFYKQKLTSVFTLRVSAKIWWHSKWRTKLPVSIFAILYTCWSSVLNAKISIFGRINFFKVTAAWREMILIRAAEEEWRNGAAEFENSIEEGAKVRDGRNMD